MKVHILGSNSFGNCYIFEAKDATLIVELGVAFKEVKKALKFDFKNVVGAIVTHEHGDHSKAIVDACTHGINVYASAGTFKALNYQSTRMKAIKSEQIFEVGPFKIFPFDVKHNAAEPLGFIINHAECGNVLFLTDTSYVDYKFYNINNIFIEANYSEEILQKRSNIMHAALAARVRRDHMSIDECLQILKNNDLSAVNDIVLIHLSDGNSDEKGFINQVKNATGKSVQAAQAGMVVNICESPF